MTLFGDYPNSEPADEPDYEKAYRDFVLRHWDDICAYVESARRIEKAAEEEGFLNGFVTMDNDILISYEQEMARKGKSKNDDGTAKQRTY